MREDDIQATLKSYIDNLPALPTSVSRILEICNDPASSPADLSKVISLDPVLMGRVMKLINSAYYGLNNRVTSLVRAIIMLGLNTVKNLALSTAVLGTIGIRDSHVLNMEEFWRHSLCVGVTSKIIAKKRGEQLKDLEEYFIAGLLHDIGKIPLNNKIPGEYKKAISHAEEHAVPLYEAEEYKLGCNHARVGQMIADNWNLNEGLCHVLSYHHAEYNGPHKALVYTVSVSNYFANLKEIGFSGNKYIREPDKTLFDYLEINLSDMENMVAEVEGAIENAKIFLRLAG